MSERDAEANKTIDNPSSIETALDSADSRCKNAVFVSESKSEFLDSVSNSAFKDYSAPDQARQISDAIRTPPICPTCGCEMDSKKGYVRSDGVNAVTWMCRTCGTKAYTWTPGLLPDGGNMAGHGQDQGQGDHDNGSKSSPLGDNPHIKTAPTFTMDAFDSFMQDAFGMHRVPNAVVKSCQTTESPIMTDKMSDKAGD